MPATTRTRPISREDRIPTVARPRNDAYTILLCISLLATVLGCLMLYMDFSKYGNDKPPAPPHVSPIKQMAAEGAGGGAQPIR